MKRHLLKPACVFILCLFYPVSESPARDKPAGLMTDLVEHTDRVYINGYPSEISLREIEHVVEPVQYVKIASTHPSFGWIVPGRGQNVVQTSYRVVLADNYQDVLDMKGSVWDSSPVQSPQSVAVLYEGTALKPATTYFWRVGIQTNENKDIAWSDIKAFRTDEQLQPYCTPFYPLVKTVEKPGTITRSGSQSWFVDFGKASFGQLKVTLTSAAENDTVLIHLGEKNNGSKLDRAPGGTIRYRRYSLPLLKGTHSYAIKIKPDERNTGKTAVLMPGYIGEVLPFRYCEIENYHGKLDPADIYRESVHYPFDETASAFHCDNEILNQVWEMCKYSIKATSFTGIYVDGDRERIPYEADALINQLCHYGVDREYTMARRSHEYLLLHPTWPTEWIMQSVLIAWYDYLYTGDKRSLSANYELLKARTLLQLKDETGLITTTTGKQTPGFRASIHCNEQIRDIVDWPHTGILGLGKNEGGEADGFVFTDYNAVTNAYHYEALSILSGIADVLGNSEESTLLRKEAETFKKRYNKAFLNKKNYYKDGKDTEHTSLHSNMFALNFGLAPESHYSVILDYMKSRKMACSVYGSQFLLDALYKAADGEYAFSLLTATHDRSWYNMMKAGSTISMEAWDNKYKPNQDWNHAWGAAPANIIPRRLVGVTPLTPGFETIRIKPQTGALTELHSIIPTIRGSVRVDMKKQEENGLYQLTISIPANMSAEIYLPLIPGKGNYKLNGNNITTSKIKNEAFVYAGCVKSGTWTFTLGR
ncbi:MAG: alpha-L-rhamnosidase [Dysgonamonadaceae bacterium]|jgi:hypothetical protein|nr:alpha-L-rhamnosidase [Dysgonamonadaceae bacterium]